MPGSGRDPSRPGNGWKQPQARATHQLIQCEGSCRLSREELDFGLWVSPRRSRPALQNPGKASGVRGDVVRFQTIASPRSPDSVFHCDRAAPPLPDRPPHRQTQVGSGRAHGTCRGQRDLSPARQMQLSGALPTLNDESAEAGLAPAGPRVQDCSSLPLSLPTCLRRRLTRYLGWAPCILTALWPARVSSSTCRESRLQTGAAENLLAGLRLGGSGGPMWSRGMENDRHVGAEPRRAPELGRTGPRI